MLHSPFLSRLFFIENGLFLHDQIEWTWKLAKRLENQQVPFGELLLNARLERRLSRAQVSKATGISEHSLAKYEKAGLEEGGQFPPAPKLASLCFFLGIKPIKAMYSCLSDDEYWMYKAKLWEDELIDHPDNDYLSHQYFALLHDNRKLSVLLKTILDAESAEEGDGLDQFTVEYLKAEARNIFDAQRSFDNFLYSKGLAIEVHHAFTYPGHPDAKDISGNPIDWAEHDYRTHRENAFKKQEKGPEHKAPGQELASENSSKAVSSSFDHDPSQNHLGDQQPSNEELSVPSQESKPGGDP